ncbi:T9SS type A sorting domain-containing protein [Polaribacter batillariae]|uniref:T9SS type A sorting domain-containing protein n=1 Tax=Polaribacter batillariae TaxID=2808900 RepID=A0ABX7SV02_9FLAO|nr:T9SS type A sorting domain-containing protein [Polaribacter batillariae]QTD37155.1 T9SS type A sorting domain-containing protein [Polaribacter batillariae]
MEILNSANTVVLSIDHNYGNGSNTSFLNQNSATVSLPKGTYKVKVYDTYGDGWNGTGAYGKVFANGTEIFNFNGVFPNVTNPRTTNLELEFSISIGLDDASFNYSKNSYCSADSNPTPTITGETGGTFSSTSGLSINSTTGQINIAASTVGNYVVTYTTTNPDQNSSTQNIVITNSDVATFSYPTSRVNKNDVDLLPAITGQNGSFSSTSGLDLNTSTGVIDVSNSTVGIYTVTYTTNGSCPIAITDTVTIINDTFPGVSQYYNNSKKYIEYIPGTMPVIISAPHGGRLEPGEISTRSCGTNEMDDNTDVLIKEIQKKCFDQFGTYPYIIINNLHRKKLDPNRNKSVATCNNATAGIYFDAFHSFIDQASADINAKFGKGLYIDLHGQSHSIPRIEAGYNLPSNSFDEDLNNTATNATELARVTIKNLIENNISNSTFEDLIRGANSFGGIMQVTGGQRYAELNYAGCSRTQGYRIVPSNVGDGSQGSCDDTNPGTNSYFAGDFYNNIRHGSGDPSTDNTVVQGGGTVKGGGGTIDGIMTEVNRRVRDLGTVYTSTYGVSDSRSPTIPYFSRDYAKVIEKFIDIHYNDFSKFTFTENSYSIYGLDPTPTINGISGGNFSSTAGLVIDSSTGKIDVSASSQGTYVVTYQAPNVGNHYKKEVSITINNVAVTNEFIATSGNWSVDTNWSLNRVPIAVDNVLIPTGKTAFLNINEITINNFTVEGTFTINTNQSLTVNGNISNTGTFTINSGGTIIANGTSTGNLTYKRSLDANKWYLIGAPLSGQSVVNFANLHSNITRGSGSGNDQNIALATYDNTKTSNRWNYYKVGAINGLDGDDTTDMMSSGKGFTTRLTAAGDISFTGTLNTGNVNKSVVHTSSNSFNLISNPYASYVNIGNLLPNNIGVGKPLKTQTIWIWDQTENAGNGDYIPKVTVQSFKIAPGQGFFIEVENENEVVFTTSMLSHQNTDTFSKSSRPEIKLSVTDGKSEKYTEIYYIKGTTTGFDDGYDGEVFSGIANNFQIYSHLVTNDVGQKLGIQSLPNSNYESMVIPIGLKAAIGDKVTFTPESSNMPQDLYIFLEDKENNTFTKFDSSTTSYTTTLTEKSVGIGNFYLHTKSKVLSTKPTVLDEVNIFKKNNRTISINGLVDSKILFLLYSIDGKKITSKIFSSNGKSEITIPKLSSGVYLLKVKSASKEIFQKIILE